MRAQSSVKSHEDADFIHELGNLLVIPKQINGILGNDTFTQKMDKLINPSNYENNIKHVDDFILQFALKNKKKKEWTDKDIKSRTKTLAKQSYDVAVNKYSYK